MKRRLEFARWHPMRILFISKTFPREPQKNTNGVFQRLRMFVDAAAEMAGVEILFYVPDDIDVSPSAVAAREAELRRLWKTDMRLVLCPQSKDGEERSKWRRYARSTASLFHQPGYYETSGALQVQALEEALERRPDIVFAHRLEAMCPVLLTRRRLPRIMFDLDDIEHVKFLRGIDPACSRRAKQIYYSRLPALWWGERRAIQATERTFVCSEKDRSYLTDFWRLPGVRTVPNGTDLGAPLPLAAEPTLLFIGSYRYRPNAQAAEFLMEKVWPRVREAEPTAQLILAGPFPEQVRGYRTDLPQVHFTGFARDLGELYRRCRIVCCPVLVGGGTRIKIIEAACYGKPIVATRVGAEGLEMRDGEEMLLRDEPENFARACIELLRDDELCQRLGAAAYARAAGRYDRRKILPLIQTHLKGE